MLENTITPPLDPAQEFIAGSDEPQISVTSREHRHWKPFLDTLGEAMAEQFDWKAETDTIQTYEHRLTFRYLHIDAASNWFYNQQCVVISQEAALAHALPRIASADPATVANSRMAESRDLESADAQDLELAAFTRPVPSEPLKAAWTGFDREMAARWVAQIRGAVADARKGIFQHTSDDSGGYPAGAGLVQAGGARDFQEPSLTRFTRRNAEFQR